MKPGALAAPQTWFLDAVTVGGRDLLAGTLDVKAGQAVNGAIATLTQHRGSLAGTLLAETGGPVPGGRGPRLPHRRASSPATSPRSALR